MSVFKCQRCNCKENTALCNFHWRAYKGQEALCSECDPEIGKWHGYFKKEEFKEPYNYKAHGPLPEAYQHS